MNFAALQKRFVNRGTKCTPDFYVMLAYEDHFAGRRAMDSCQLLLSEFDNESDFHIRIWSFDALEGTKTSEEAVRDAIQADAIILATYQRKLPMAVRRWIDAWIPQKRRQNAALIAFLQADDDRFSLWHYLEDAAANAGLNFFATVLKRPEVRIPVPSVPVRDAWGLNE